MPLDKTFAPAEIEPRLYEGWEREGAFACDPELERGAVHDHDPAAERHRVPAHGARADVHGAGHADPLPPHDRARHAVAAGDRSRRHRHADGGGAAARRRGDRPAHLGPGEVRRARLAMESRVRRHHHHAVAPAGRLAGLAARAVHHGRRSVRRGEGGVRHAVPRRPDLSRPAAGQLGPEIADGDLGSGGGEPGGPEFAVVHPLSDRGRAGTVHRGRHHAAGDDVGRYGGGGASVASDVGGADREVRCAALGWARDPDRRGRVCRSGKRHRRGEDHARARLQRLRGRAAARSADAVGAGQDRARDGGGNRRCAGGCRWRGRPGVRARAGRDRTGSPRAVRSWRNWNDWI